MRITVRASALHRPRRVRDLLRLRRHELRRRGSDDGLRHFGVGCHGSCEGHLVYGRPLPRPARRVLSGHEQQGNGASGDDFESPGFAVQHDVPDHGRQGRGSELSTRNTSCTRTSPCSWNSATSASIWMGICGRAWALRSEGKQLQRAPSASAISSRRLRRGSLPLLRRRLRVSRLGRRRCPLIQAFPAVGIHDGKRAWACRGIILLPRASGAGGFERPARHLPYRESAGPLPCLPAWVKQGAGYGKSPAESRLPMQCRKRTLCAMAGGRFCMREQRRSRMGLE